ncbi:hypothetical protein ENSA5_15450 [Enhygromyxa salina]|uniref:Uncharacterized protein n=1 Tax=Enhygromyxa salina TaxID=215803 RepID=A0A2S9YEI0_9BACT|nr:hypothetical protein [Enhygromyxa salina]PRQ03515.1 hypothetical protein ENSA5_15450 [Enhygromyxa salina]
MKAASLALLLAFAPPPGLGAPAGETEANETEGAAPAPAPAPPSAAPPVAAPPAKPSPANADAPITVTTRLTPDPSHIGDLLTLEVIVAYPRDHAINLPNGLDFAPLELVSIEEAEVESTGNDLRQRFTITLQHFAVGEAEVPSFPVTWVDRDDAVHTYTVAPHPFVVESLLVNEAEPEVRGEDPMISLEYPNVRLAIIIYSVLAGVVLAGLIAMLLVMWRRRERPIVLPPPVPPHERALAELAELASEREELIGAGDYQDYYLRLTEIGKRYLGGRFGFEALDRTTEEIQELLGRGQVDVDPLDPKQVLTFLQDCDLVKFARLSPPDEEAREALELVRDMVEQSTPRDKADEASDEAAGPNATPSSGAEPVDPDRARASRPAPPSPATTPASETSPTEPAPSAEPASAPEPEPEPKESELRE